MKIDKTNPAHWIALLLFAANVFGAWLLRPLCHRRGARPTVILYGHKLAGNLLALYRHWQAQAQSEYSFVFLTMDVRYARELAGQGVPVQVAIYPGTAALLVRAAAVISDHGLHSMSFLPGRCSIRFFDVWHGIMFKGFAPQDFRVQHRYTETWVASPLLKKLYVECFGFRPDRVKVTGYARTDCLVGPPMDAIARARQMFGLDAPDVGRIVLFAPTWQRDAMHQSTYPFGVTEETFLGALSTLAQRLRATIVIRAHLNTAATDGVRYPRVVYRPFAQFPDAEHLLLACDVLVCDWSSIAFDWLLLNRPTVFIDRPIPTPRGFALGPNYRFGDVVGDFDTLLASLEQALCEPAAHLERFTEQRAKVLTSVYGAYADGRAAQRCLQCLQDSTAATFP